MRLRRTASLATVSVLTAALASAAVPATGDQIRTETSLGGFSVHANAAPFKVLLDDPANPIPRPADGPIVEADPAYSEADLDSGPTSRGIGASLWPGGLLGEGLPQVAAGAPQWPLKAEARYPDKPYIATGGGTIPNTPITLDDGGRFMKGQALGLDALGTARMNPEDVPGSIDLGTVSSTSTATVKDGVAIGTSVSHVSDVSLLAGIIKVGSVSTNLTVRSDGKKGTSTGSTVVNGLTINGVGYVVDDQGARPIGAPVPGSGPLPTGSLDPAKALGITVSGISQDRTQDAQGATRDAKGLRITVDTIVLRGVLNQVPSPVTDLLVTVFSQAPKEIQGFLFYTLSTTPKITFILGAGQGRSAATLPITFDFPPLPTGGFLPPPVVTDTGTTDGGMVGIPTSPIDPSVIEPDAPPVVSTPDLAATGNTNKDPFHGIPASLLLLVAALAGTGGWGLVRLRTSAFALAAAGPCTSESNTSLPDLRGA